eukprot:scaffold11725_cov19-Tisochrysis_lutea.AAC.1
MQMSTASWGLRHPLSATGTFPQMQRVTGIAGAGALGIRRLSRPAATSILGCSLQPQSAAGTTIKDAELGPQMGVLSTHSTFTQVQMAIPLPHRSHKPCLSSIFMLDLCMREYTNKPTAMLTLTCPPSLLLPPPRVDSCADVMGGADFMGAAGRSGGLKRPFCRGCS